MGISFSPNSFAASIIGLCFLISAALSRVCQDWCVCGHIEWLSASAVLFAQIMQRSLRYMGSVITSINSSKQQGTLLL